MVAVISSICASVTMSGGESAMVSPRTARQHAFLQALQEHRVAARPRLAGNRLQIDPRHQAEIADVDHVRRALQGVHRLLEAGREIARALEELLLVIEREGGLRGGGCERVAGVGVAVRKLDRAGRAAVHHGIVDRRGSR